VCDYPKTFLSNSKVEIEYLLPYLQTLTLHYYFNNLLVKAIMFKQENSSIFKIPLHQINSLSEVIPLHSFDTKVIILEGKIPTKALYVFVIL